MKLWAGVNLTATNYNAQNNTAKVCITSTNQADPACKCKSTNSCMKVGLSGIKGLNVGSMSVLSSSIDPLNKLASGQLDAANVDSAALANLAAKAQNLKDQLESSKKLAGVKKKKDQAEKALLKKIQDGAAKYPQSNFLANSSGSPSGLPSNPAEAAKMLENELKTEPTAINGADQIATGGDATTEENLEFGLTQEDLAAQESQIAEVMKEDLDYGGNDTNEDAKANIFELVSHRYQKSGMKRLFEEPSPAAAAPAAGPAPTAPTAQK